jgi:pimeloyl-ACP methyl ester carboxylesterase
MRFCKKAFTFRRLTWLEKLQQFFFPEIVLSYGMILGILVFPAQWAPAAPPFYPDKSKVLVYRDAFGNEYSVTNPTEWSRRREHILANMQEVMGAFPNDSSRVPLDVQITEEVIMPTYIRKKLTFAVEKTDRVPAFLLIPRQVKRKLPAVLCLHQTVAIGKGEPAGLGKNDNLRYAVHLAERGYVTLAPDYPSFGDYTFDFANSSFQSGTMKAIWNNMRATDLLQGLSEVDPDRIGCIGHSLGGHNTMFTAAFEPRIKAMVSNCGFNCFPKYFKGNLKGWSSARYMPRIATVYNLNPTKMPFDFPEVVAALAPRPFLAIAPLQDDNFEVSGVKDCIAAALPVYDLLRAREKLAASYPDCKHDFPPESRIKAYEWLDRWLK